jgi:hypothetical protein
MNAIAWLLTYSLPIAIIAFGTLNQGDDGPWSMSLFVFAPLALIGSVILLLRLRRIYEYSWMGVFHIITAILAFRILPAYWTNATIGGDHIGAGFDQDYIGVFEASRWHFWWAPTMTVISAFVVILAFIAITMNSAQQVAPRNR